LKTIYLCELMEKLSIRVAYGYATPKEERILNKLFTWEVQNTVDRYLIGR
jgi:hypothetical protein